MRDSDGSILEQLGALVREDDEPIDPRFEALLQGELSDDEYADLHAEAALSESGTRDLALFSPLSQIQTEAVIKAVLAESQRETPVSSWRRRAMYGVGALAAAAAVFLWLGTRKTTPDDQPVIADSTPIKQWPPMATYTLKMGPGEVAHLGASQTEERPHYSAGSQVKLTLWGPKSEGEIKIETFRRRGDERTRWPMKITESAQKITLHAEADTLPMGTWTIEVHLSRAGSPPQVLTAQLVRGTH